MKNKKGERQMAKYKLDYVIATMNGKTTIIPNLPGDEKETSESVLKLAESLRRVKRVKNNGKPDVTETNNIPGAGASKSRNATSKNAAKLKAAGSSIRRTVSRKSLEASTVCVGPRIKEASAGFFAETFGNLNGGTKYILDVFPALYNLTLREMKGIFTEEELRILLEVVNSNENSFPGMGFPGKFMMKTIFWNLEMGNEYFTWKVDIKAIKDKFDRLTHFQALAFIIWCQPGVDLFGDEEDGENEELRKIIEEKIKMLLEVKD
jgi:hypothetical protein